MKLLARSHDKLKQVQVSSVNFSTPITITTLTVNERTHNQNERASINTQSPKLPQSQTPKMNKSHHKLVVCTVHPRNEPVQKSPNKTKAKGRHGIRTGVRLLQFLGELSVLVAELIPRWVWLHALGSLLDGFWCLSENHFETAHTFISLSLIKDRRGTYWLDLLRDASRCGNEGTMDQDCQS